MPDLIKTTSTPLMHFRAGKQTWINYRMKTYTNVQCAAPHHTHFMQHNACYCIGRGHGVDGPIARGLRRQWDGLSVGPLCKCVQRVRQRDVWENKPARSCVLHPSPFFMCDTLPPLHLIFSMFLLLPLETQPAAVVTLKTLKTSENLP